MVWAISHDPLIGTQILTAVTLACAFGLSVAGLVRVEHLLALAALSNTFRAFDEPTRLSLIPQLVERDRLPNAIALGSIPWQASRMIGPSVTGILCAPIPRRARASRSCASSPRG